MATKLKAIIPPAISQRPAFTSRDDGQQLIRNTVHKSTSSRPKFSIRSKKSACKKSKKVKKADKTQRSQAPAWDTFEQSDPSGENGKRLKTNPKKKRISLKEWESHQWGQAKFSSTVKNKVELYSTADCFSVESFYFTVVLNFDPMHSSKIVTKAGQRIEWLLKKGAKYFGIAIIKIFNQPGLYTEESRTCVC